MDFPDGRVKEGLFEDNKFKGPMIETPEMKQMKAQEILVNNTLQTPPSGSRIRIKSRGALKSRGDSKVAQA